MNLEVQLASIAFFHEIKNHETQTNRIWIRIHSGYYVFLEIKRNICSSLENRENLSKTFIFRTKLSVSRRFRTFIQYYNIIRIKQTQNIYTIQQYYPYQEDLEHLYNTTILSVSRRSRTYIQYCNIIRIKKIQNIYTMLQYYSSQED